MQLHKILIHRVFPALRKKNIICRPYFWCCRTCAHAAAFEQARRKGKRGWVFWPGNTHERYRELLKKGRGVHLYLYFSHITRQINRNIEKVGQEAADACRQAGLRVVWNGSHDTGIRVSIKKTRKR